MVTAVAARDPERARGYAAEHGVPFVSDDYETLVRREDIDLVYNALPPAGHKRWTLAALEAGKHVLCEKPFARNAGEARAMVEAADDAGRVLIEAFHYRFHNVVRAAVALIREGALGEVRSAEAHFDAAIPRSPGELRWSSDQSGGALMDLGCYSVHALRSLVGEPKVTSATGVFEGGVDASIAAEMAFVGGATGAIACSMTAPGFGAALKVTGARGTLEIVNYIAPQNPRQPCRFTTMIDGVRRDHATDGPTTYAAQLAHVADVLAGRTPQLTGGADAVANMTAIDAIYAAAGRPSA